MAGQAKIIGYNPDDELNVHLSGKAKVSRHDGWSGAHTAQRVVPVSTPYSQRSIVMVESVRRAAMTMGKKTTIVEHARYLQEEQEKNKGRGDERNSEPERAYFFDANEDRVRTHRDIAVERQSLDPSRAEEREQLKREMNASWENKWAGDRHHFRVIVSPANGRQMDMVRHIRDLMTEMGKDQGTRLEWKAVIHRDTEHVHAQIIVRAKRDDGRTLYLDRKYVGEGLRHRSQELATRELGIRHRDRNLIQAERAMEQERREKLHAMVKQQSKGRDGGLALER